MLIEKSNRVLEAESPKLAWSVSRFLLLVSQLKIRFVYRYSPTNKNEYSILQLCAYSDDSNMYRWISFLFSSSFAKLQSYSHKTLFLLQPSMRGEPPVGVHVCTYTRGCAAGSLKSSVTENGEKTFECHAGFSKKKKKKIVWDDGEKRVSTSIFLKPD